MEKDDTQYRLITSDYVSVGDFEGHPMLKVEPEGLRLLAAEAFHDVALFWTIRKPAIMIKAWP